MAAEYTPTLLRATAQQIADTLSASAPAAGKPASAAGGAEKWRPWAFGA